MQVAEIVESPDLEATQEQPLESVLRQLDEVRKNILVNAGLVRPSWAWQDGGLFRRQAE